MRPRTCATAAARRGSNGAALLVTTGPREAESLGEYEGETLYHASLDPAEYEARLAEAGFDVVARVVEDRDCGGHTVWLAHMTREE